MSYLHGVEIKETAKSAVLAAGDSSVIALVGTAPLGSVGVVKLITSMNAGVAEFGEDIGGFTIPAALNMIFSHVAAKVLVVNVLDNADVAALLEPDGKMTRVVVGDDELFATHIYQDTLPVAVDFAADIINGIELLSGIEDVLGIKPNLIIAPGYSQLQPVNAKMVAVAEKLNGFALVDMVAADVAAALVARNAGDFASASPALILGYPAFTRYNGQRIGIPANGFIGSHCRS